MCRALIACLALILSFAANPAWAQMRWHDTLVNFATLPAGVRFPEGITANPATGDIYVATFDTIGPNPNKLLRYSRHGQLVGSRTIGTPMLGLAFGPSDSKVYITNFNQSKIQRVASDLDGTIEDVATLPSRSARPRTASKAIPIQAATRSSSAPSAFRLRMRWCSIAAATCMSRTPFRARSTASTTRRAASRRAA